jgi:hypothetical protein
MVKDPDLELGRDKNCQKSAKKAGGKKRGIEKRIEKQEEIAPTCTALPVRQHFFSLPTINLCHPVSPTLSGQAACILPSDEIGL